jgi:TonB family protein
MDQKKLCCAWLGLAVGACAAAPRAADPVRVATRFPDAGQLTIMMADDTLPRPARLGRGPRYPVRLRDRRVTGQLVAAFVIDGTGRVELPSVSFVEPGPHPDFQKSVCEFLRDARFVPASSGGVPQRTLVFMPFGFSLSIAPPLGPAPNVRRHQTLARELPREELVAELEKRPHC